MAVLAPIPGTGIDRRTGKVISGWPHVVQSLETLFTTEIGERVMRRYIGSNVPAFLGRNMTKPTILRFWQAICVAIHRPAAAGGEPRFRVTKIVAVGDALGMRAGQIGFAIAGVWYPRGHLGDFSVAIPKTLTIGSIENTLRVLSHS